MDHLRKNLCMFLVGVGLLFVQTGFSQTHTVHVYGTVTDEKGIGLSHASVCFIPQDDGDTTSAQTETSGAYSLLLVLAETGVKEGQPYSPSGFQLFQNYPNPFNPGTVIEFELPQPEHVKLTIFNIRGQVVKVLAARFYPAGLSRVRWDGTDSMGRGVAAGIYFYRLKTENFTKTRKMLLLDGGEGTIGSTLTSSRKSLLKSKMLFQETFTICVEKEGFYPFVNENFVVTSEDTAIEKNMVLAKSGYFLYVGNLGGDEIFVVDTDGNAVVDTLRGFDYVGGLAITKSGAKLYVSAGKVYVVDCRTRQSREIYDQSAKVHVAPDGGVFILSSPHYQSPCAIGIIDTLSDAISFFDTLDVANRYYYQDVVFARNSPLMFATNNKNRLIAYNYVTKEMVCTYKNLYNPLNMALSQGDTKIYCTAYAYRLVVFDLETDCVLSVLGANHLGHLALSPDGEYLYITDPQYLKLEPVPSGKVYIFQTSTNSYVGYIDVGRFSGQPTMVTDRIALMPDGKTAYVSNWMDMIFVIDLQLREVIKIIQFGQPQTQVSAMVLGLKQ